MMGKKEEKVKIYIHTAEGLRGNQQGWHWDLHEDNLLYPQTLPREKPSLHCDRKKKRREQTTTICFLSAMYNHKQLIDFRDMNETRGSTH